MSIVERVMTRALLLACAAAAVGLALGPRTQAAQTPPTAVVEELHASLLAAMKESDSLGYSGRRERLAPVIAHAFDIPSIARTATGPHWDDFAPEQRRELMNALWRLTVAAYASRFDTYAGERFRIVAQRPAPRDTVMVKTDLVESDGETVSINYLVRPTSDGWRIVDVYLKGVYSELAMRRSEYIAVIERRGLAGLLATIEKKISRYETGDSMEQGR